MVGKTNNQKKENINIFEAMIFLIIFSILPFFFGGFKGYIAYLLNEIMIMALAALAFNLLFHTLGMLAFGQAAFIGLGGYLLTLILINTNISYFFSIIFSLLGVAIFAYLIGVFCIRVKEIYFSLLTTALAQLLYLVVFKWYGFTGGDNGISGIKIPYIFNNFAFLYYYILLIVSVCFFVVWKLKKSAFGLTLLSIRDNEERAMFIGIKVRKYRIITFIISALLTGVSGILYVTLQRSIHPAVMHWSMSGDLVLMTMLGGFMTFFGPLLGSAIMMYIRDLLSAYTEYWLIFVGSIIVFCVIIFPKGILGTIHDIYFSRVNKK